MGKGAAVAGVADPGRLDHNRHRFAGVNDPGYSSSTWLVNIEACSEPANCLD